MPKLPSKHSILNQGVLKRQKGTYKITKAMKDERMGIQQGKLYARMQQGSKLRSVPAFSKRKVQKMSNSPPSHAMRPGPSLFK